MLNIRDELEMDITDADIIVGKMLGSSDDFNYYLKIPVPQKPLADLLSCNPFMLAKACALDSLFAAVYNAEKLTLDDVFRHFQPDVRGEKIKAFKESTEYKCYIKDILFDQEDNCRFIVHDDLLFRDFVTQVSVCLHLTDITSTRLLSKIKDWILSDPDCPEDVTVKNLIDSAFYAVENGIPMCTGSQEEIVARVQEDQAFDNAAMRSHGLMNGSSGTLH